MFLHKQFTKFKLIIVGVCLLLTAVLTIQTSTATPSIGSNTAEFATTTLPLGGSTDSHMVRTADFDGDGLDDLFFARNGANQVILNGSGSQSFGTANTLGVALGDIDGDGDIDAVTANETVADRVWLNNGAGVFTDSGQSLTGAITSTAVDLADLDKDGDLDAVFIGDGFVTILTNNGTGTFTTTAFFFADDGRDVRLGDVDNDGDIDAVFAYNTTIPYGSIMLNNGTGTLAPPPAGTLDTSYAAGIVLGDVDADGDLDAFVSTSSGRPNVIMLNDGTGQFTAGQTLNTTGTAEAAFGDVDNDGDLDFYLANEGSTPNDIWLNDGTGTFASNGQAFGNDNTRSVVLFDLDTDGDLDVATANLGTADYIRANNLPHRNVLFQNNGTPIGSATTVTYDVRVGDLDGDGDEDVIAVKPGSSWSWLNDGTGAFTSGNQLFNGLAAQSADLGDLDGDGDLDLFIAVSGGGDAVWFNDGNGVFTDSGQTLGSNSANIEAVRLGDLDQDGDLDAIVGRGTGNSGIWLNNGNGVFVAGSPVPVTSVRDVAVGDVDADGDLDLFFARYSFSNVLWLNDGTGTFADSGQLIGGANQSQAVDFGDVDNDGDLDVLVGNDDGINAPSKLYLNDGAGILTDSGFNFGVGNQAREALLRDLERV